MYPQRYFPPPTTVQRAVAGRLLILYYLRIHLQLPRDHTVLTRTAEGRPVLVTPPTSNLAGDCTLTLLACVRGLQECEMPADTPHFDFNISHHGDWVVLVGVKHRSVQCASTNCSPDRMT